MKHLSLWLTVMLLGGLPLAAAAVDYGSNSILLAADTSAPQLPGAMGHNAKGGESPKSGLMTIDANPADDSAEANDVVPVPAAQRMTPSAASPRMAPASRNSGPSASGKPRTSTAHPTPAAPASWQSLLPGSIQ